MARSTVTSFFLAFLILGIFFLSREDNSGPLVRSQIMMGTVVEIRIHDRDAARFDSTVTEAFAAMVRIEQLMSPHLPDSEISRISTTPGPVTVSDDTAAVMQIALSVAEASDGAFDVGLGRVVKLWGFAEGEPSVPSENEVAAALRGTGPGSLRLINGRIEKESPQLLVDFGGVAKGYAIDRAIDILAAAGAESVAVNAGGDMRLLGDRGGTPWRIGIQHPRQREGILARLNLANRSVVTSGDYERFFEQDGVRYHHILDPTTGTPARLCQSVTVVADRAALADAMATAVFVLGPQLGLALLEKTDGVEGLIVDAGGKAEVSSGLQGVIEWQ